MFYDIVDAEQGCDLVAIVNAHSVEDAQKKARDLGYDLERYRVEESEE
jgi:hypothetical protein